MTDPGPEDLVFRGRVTGLDPMRAQGGVQGIAQWRVSFAVDAVESGAFAGEAFQFALHSPAQSGLALGGTYRVHARRTAEGFTVDPSQWRPRL